MASGSSGRSNPNSKGFDFTSSDDILCSYEDYETNQDNSNGTHSDPPSLSSNSTKEFHKSRMVRSSMFPAPACSTQEDSFSQDVIVTVEKTMKKHTDNLMRFLEGISSRLSQLELYCYNLDKSIGEMRTDLVRDHGEADSKLRSVEKHLQEVHRSVQILRDKQELAETQKELAKMQLVQKESSPANEDKASVPSSDQKSPDNTSDGHGQELALVLPNQVPSQVSLTPRPAVQQQTVAPPPPQAGTQSQGYYLPPAGHMSNQQAPVHPQPAQNPYLPADAQYRIPQMQEISRVPPQPAQSQVNQVHPLPQYQQQWSQQPQIRPPSPGPYPSYLPSQPPNPSQETVPNSVSMLPYSGISQQQGSSRAEQMPYGYGGLGQAVQQQPPPPQHLKSNFGVQPNAGYMGPGNPYVLYESEGGQRNHPPQQPHFPQGGYPPTSVPQPNAGNHMARPPQFTRGHPYGELVEKLASMGYRGDHVASVIQRLEETGQPVDFNSVLDKLNGLSSGGGQRGWSG